MAGCARAVAGVNGTAHGSIENHRAITRLVLRAVTHLIQQGTQQCIGGQCDSGACSFGVTSVSEDIQVALDPDGKSATITITGDGECFCS